MVLTSTWDLRYTAFSVDPKEITIQVLPIGAMKFDRVDTLPSTESILKIKNINDYSHLAYNSYMIPDDEDVVKNKHGVFKHSIFRAVLENGEIHVLEIAAVFKRESEGNAINYNLCKLSIYNGLLPYNKE
jgi:hypothetical protein